MTSDAKKPDGASLRVHERIPTDLGADVSCASWQVVEQFVVANVSKGGVFIRCERPPPIDSEVQVAVTLPNGRRVKVGGVVRHSLDAAQAAASGRPSGMGVEISVEYLDTLEQLLKVARQELLAASKGEASAPSSAPVPAAAAQAAPSRNVADVVGIDLGVCYSRLAIGVDDTVHAVPVDGDERTCPSVVYYPERGAPIVGAAARQRQALEGERVVASIKRVLGRFYSDPLISGFLHSASFRSARGPADSILVQIGEDQHAVPQVGADILKHLRAMAARRIGRDVTKAVLSHPVAFDEVQKAALCKAAKFAGIEVVDLIEEPVAVALAYGLGQGKNEIIAVYDFGGGTFDFTVIDMSADGYRVLASDGDGWLGGDDFDRALADAIANSIWRRTKVELRDRAVEWQVLLMACEEAKRQLSFAEVTELCLPGVNLGAGSGEIKMPVNRDALLRVSRELFERSLEVCRNALSQLGLEPRDMTTVLISGGTSRIPFIRAGLNQFFDRPVAGSLNPEEAVALGAGLHAARKSGHSATRAAAV